MCNTPFEEKFFFFWVSLPPLRGASFKWLPFVCPQNAFLSLFFPCLFCESRGLPEEKLLSRVVLVPFVFFLLNVWRYFFHLILVSSLCIEEVPLPVIINAGPSFSRGYGCRSPILFFLSQHLQTIFGFKVGLFGAILPFFFSSPRFPSPVATIFWPYSITTLLLSLPLLFSMELFSEQSFFWPRLLLFPFPLLSFDLWKVSFLPVHKSSPLCWDRRLFLFSSFFWPLPGTKEIYVFLGEKCAEVLFFPSLCGFPRLLWSVFFSWWNSLLFSPYRSVPLPPIPSFSFARWPSARLFFFTKTVPLSGFGLSPPKLTVSFFCRSSAFSWSSFFFSILIPEHFSLGNTTF